MTPISTRFIIIISIIPWLFATYFKARPWVHILQLEGYKGREYLSWVKKNWRKIFAPQGLFECGFIFSVALIVSWTPIPDKIALWLLLGAWLLLQAFQLLKRPETSAKKKLVFTARVLRLVAGFKVVTGLEVLIVLWLNFSMPGLSEAWLRMEVVSAAKFYSTLQLMGLFVVINVWLANELIRPLEEFVNKGFFKEAQAVVKQLAHIKIIGITGSYGKTSTKFILNQIMSTNCPTLMTPESYNTPMGISKVIRGDLKVFHHIFIVEMGARYKGDIAEICRLTPPEMGILTAIGPQHLETFGSQEAITSTKGELLEALPADGVAVINQDNPYCRELAQEVTCKCLRYGLNDGDNKDVWADKISCGPEGTSFTLHTACGEQVDMRTPLLGEHNVYNILAASCAALYWKVPLQKIVRAIARLQPVPHRLQLVKGEGGITIIDDAFNSNPTGARVALDVLKSFSAGRKFLITPGMVELGEEEFELNKEFGKLAARACDIVILVGPKRTLPIVDGLKEAGFNAGNICVVNDLDTARQVMGKLVKPGDTVLFENDLPDNYNE